MNKYNISQEASLEIRVNLSNKNLYVFTQTLIPSFVYILLLALIGIPGNALVCYVYKIKIRNNQLSSNIFILALSFFDLINCLTSLPIELDLLLNFVKFDKPVLCAGSRFITFFCNNASSVILLAIALDRLVAFLSGPIRRRLEPYMAKCIIVIAALISGCLSWPMFVFFGTYEIPLGQGVIGYTCSIKKQFVKSTKIRIFTIALLSLHILFDLLFLIIYSIIGKRICYDSGLVSHRSKDNNVDVLIQQQKRKHSDSSTDEDYGKQKVKTNDSEIRLNFISKGRSENTKLSIINKVSSDSELTTITAADECTGNTPQEPKQNNIGHSKTFDILRTQRASPSPSECKIFNRRTTANRTSFMLFIVTMAYVISFLPYCVLVVVRHVSKGTFYSELNATQKTMYQFFLRSYCLSSAINPVIYSFINASFRRKCKEAIAGMFLCSRCTANK